MTETNIEALQRIIAEQKEAMRVVDESRRQAWDQVSRIKRASDEFWHHVTALSKMNEGFKVVLALYKPVDSEIRR